MTEHLKGTANFSLKSHWRFSVFIAAFGFLLYANTIRNNYAIDDGAIILSNPNVQQGLKGIPGIFTTDIWHFENADLGYYRPLSVATFAIEHEFFGNNPHVSHFINALLYALTGMLLCLVLLRIFSSYSPAFSFIIALLFIAHPIHTEVVANIKSRDEILSFLNLLIAIYFLLRSLEGNRIWIRVSCIFYFLALLSKETAMAGIVVLPGILYFTSTLNYRQILRQTVPFILILLVFQWQKYAALGHLFQPDANDIVSFPYAATNLKLSTALAHLWWYIKLIFIPYPLSYNYAYNQIPASEWTSVTTLLGISAAAILLFGFFNKLSKKTPLQLGVLLFIASLLPALGFVVTKGGILAERFLYAPSLGFCMAMVWIFFKTAKLPFNSQLSFSSVSPLKFAPLVIVILCYSFITIFRNDDWKDDLTISSHDVKVTPNSCQVHLHYGKNLVELGAKETNPDKKTKSFNSAIEQLHDAIDINPHYARAYFQLAYANQVLVENDDSAIYYYNRAIDEAPGYALAYSNLAGVYIKLRRTQLAEHYLQKALEIDSNLPGTAQRLQLLQQPQNVAPVDSGAAMFEYYSTTGIKYAREKNFGEALKYLSKAVELRPKSIDALVNLAACHGMMQQYAKSEEILIKAQQLEPDNKSVIQNLFTLYHLTGNKAKEEEYRIKLARLKTP